MFDASFLAVLLVDAESWGNSCVGIRSGGGDGGEGTPHPSKLDLVFKVVQNVL